MPAHEKESSKEAQRYFEKKMTLHKCLIQMPLSIYSYQPHILLKIWLVKDILHGEIFSDRTSLLS